MGSSSLSIKSRIFQRCDSSIFVTLLFRKKLDYFYYKLFRPSRSWTVTRLDYSVFLDARLLHRADAQRRGRRAGGAHQPRVGPGVAVVRTWSSCGTSPRWRPTCPSTARSPRRCPRRAAPTESTCGGSETNRQTAESATPRSDLGRRTQRSSATSTRTTATAWGYRKGTAATRTRSAPRVPTRTTSACSVRWCGTAIRPTC